MKKSFLFRNLIMSLIVILTVFLLYLISKSTLPELMAVVRNGDMKSIQNYLKHQSTLEGLFCVGLIQMLQIWTIVLSAIPLQFASGIVFDAMPTFFVCSIAAVLSMTLSFLVWRHLSHIIEKVIPLSEREEALIKNALNRKTSPDFLLFLMCFIFVMPNGLIPIMASKTDIKLSKYIAAIAPGVSFNVLICSLEGDRLIAGDWTTFIAVMVISALIIWLFWKVHKVIVLKNEKK